LGADTLRGNEATVESERVTDGRKPGEGRGKNFNSGVDMDVITARIIRRIILVEVVGSPPGTMLPDERRVVKLGTGGSKGDRENNNGRKREDSEPKRFWEDRLSEGAGKNYQQKKDLSGQRDCLITSCHLPEIEG